MTEFRLEAQNGLGEHNGVLWTNDLVSGSGLLYWVRFFYFFIFFLPPGSVRCGIGWFGWLVGRLGVGGYICGVTMRVMVRRVWGMD